MIWAKAQKKQFFHRPRMAMMTIYTVGLCLLSLAAFAEMPGQDYTVTLNDAEKQIAEELMNQGMGDDLQVSIIGRRTQEIVRRKEPVMMDVQNLSADKAGNRFSATLAFATEASLNRPAQNLGSIAVSGRFDQMVDVPVVKYRVNSSNVLREEDLEWQKMPLSRTKRETVLEMAALVGKSPVRGLSPGRAIESDEVQSPHIVHRRTPVRMSYQSQSISIQAVGTAMQDGAMGDKIKVRNDDSGLEVDAMVVDRGRVEIMPAIAFN